MYDQFVSYLFLSAMIVTGLGAWWVIKHDGLDVLDKMTGIFALDDEAEPPRLAKAAAELRASEAEFTRRRLARIAETKANQDQQRRMARAG